MLIEVEFESLVVTLCYGEAFLYACAGQRATIPTLFQLEVPLPWEYGVLLTSSGK